MTSYVYIVICYCIKIPVNLYEYFTLCIRQLVVWCIITINLKIYKAHNS